MSDASVSQPTADEVREELARVLGSPSFASAARAQRFLKYVVEQVLAGQGDGIKEVVLGSEVFDRGSDFDPRIDTIVRVEAGKLRKRLDDYYASDGAGGALRIDIPKGSYVPRFERRAPAGVPSEAAATAPAGRSRSPLKWLAAAAIAAVAGGAVWAMWWRPPAVPATASIAVLPFENFSPDPANEYLADGLSEDLTDALSRSGLRVVARTSAYTYKGKSTDVREIGRRLNAEYLIEGSVRRDGERLKVTAQLVRTDDGYHVWSRSFERTMRDALAMQSEIARTVVESVAASVGGGRAEPRAHVPTTAAFDLFLQGAHALGSDLFAAERLLQASAAADPEYARPHLMLAGVYVRSDIFGIRPTPELAAKARAEVDKALELDPGSAEAHALRGSILARHWYEWDAAEREIRRALELDPHSSFVHNELAQNVLAPQERWEEAMVETQRALELDPLSTSVAAGKAFLFLLRRDVPASLAAFQEAVARNPQPLEVSGLVMALVSAGRMDEADRASQKLGPMAKAPLLAALRAYGLGRAGRLADARAAARELEDLARTQFVSAVHRSVAFSGLGDMDEAFRQLSLARQEQSSALIFLRVGDFYDPLRADPRFTALLADVGLSDQDLERRRVNRK